VPYLLDDIPETAIKFYLYSFFGAMYPKNSLLVGTITGLITSIITQPLDVIQTKLICNINNEKINYKKVNYFNGMLLSLLINTIQSAVFFYIHYVIRSLNIFPV
jgi:hypothetical protein